MSGRHVETTAYAWTIVSILERDYGIKHDHALRVVEIVAEHGLDTEPVDGGFIEIRLEGQPGYQIYTITERFVK